LRRFPLATGGDIWVNNRGRKNKVDLKAHKIALLAAIFDLYTWFAIFIDDFERPTTPKRSEEEDRKGGNLSPMLNVALQIWLIDLTTDETFGVEDRVGRVRVERIFGRVTDPSFSVRASIREKAEGRTHSRSSSVKATHEGVIR